MPRLNHKNIGDVQKTAYLTGIITAVDSEFDTVDFDGVGKCPNGVATPLFYHCEPDSAQRSNGALEGAAGAFAEDDEVIVQCEVVSDGVYKPLYVIGFVDKPKQCAIERVYFRMRVGDTYRCFVWDVEGNKYAVINKNDGESAVFPCDPDDISNWYDKQENVGDGLFSVSDCGRNLFSTIDISCSVGDWGTSGSDSDSIEESSDCGCDFIDTGSCSAIWDFTTQCYDNPPNWIWSGSSNKTVTQDILWQGFTWEEEKPKKIQFLNNEPGEEAIINAFRVELQSSRVDSYWATDGGSGGASCAEDKLISGIYESTYEFKIPINNESILEVNYSGTASWNAYWDTGAQSDEDYLVAARFNQAGKFSDKIIAQIYTIETRTVTRDATCCLCWGECCGSGCVGDSCPWQNEVYQTNGLNLGAQVGVFDGTEGVDPTGLSRNSNFESAISDVYDVLRAEEVVPDGDLALIFIELHILNG